MGEIGTEMDNSEFRSHIQINTNLDYISEVFQCIGKINAYRPG